MKALITGSAGFVGTYLTEELHNAGYEVIGFDRVKKPGTIQGDLLDADFIKASIHEEKPDVIFHLAAMADVGLSWKKPQQAFELNVIATINLMEAVRAFGEKPIKLIMVGSSDQYGHLGASGISVNEEVAVEPASPYAVSKKAQEDIAKVYGKSYGLEICMTRSFNHGGAGQKTGFMIPDFASGIVKIERGESRELLVGNLSSKRDFTHVKDVVRAYRLIAEKGDPGQIYNVGSGKTWSAQEILDQLCSMAKCTIPVRQDPCRMRPSDTPVICCDHSKLTLHTGWTPVYSMMDILTDTLSYYRNQK